MNFEAYLILVLILAIVILLSWKLWMFINKYVKFPKYPLIPHLVTAQVLRKIPPHIPFNSFFFQTLIHISEKFRKEGMFLAWGLQPHLFIFGEEAVKIFSNEDTALDKSYKYDILRNVSGTGLLTSHTEDWKNQRKMLNPVFHVGMLKNKLFIFNKNSDILVEKLKETINHPYIDILDYVKPCTLGAICEYTMGLECNRPENKENIENYANMMTNAQKILVYRIANPWLHYRFMMNIIPAGRKFLKTVNDIHIFTRKVILEMKESIYRKQKEIKEDYPEDDEESRKSFAHILHDHHLKNPSFTIEDLESQVITFMATGYESVAYTIMWCLFLLGLHPEVQEKAYNEVLFIPEGHIKYEDLINLKYLDCVIKETLRLYPTAPIYARRLNKDILFGKYVVPKDTTVTFFLYALHRNPEVFPDPEKYDPERFMNGNQEKIRLNFLPFSEGIRSCIGKRFAMLELKVVLAHILRHFWIRSLDKREEVDLCWEIVLAPVKPPRFNLTPR